MPSIKENKHDNKIVSYQFACCLGRDANGKQIRRYNTWIPPEGLSPAKAKKAAERAADAWEEQLKEEYEKDIKSPKRAKIKELSRVATDFLLTKKIATIKHLRNTFGSRSKQDSIVPLTSFLHP